MRMQSASQDQGQQALVLAVCNYELVKDQTGGDACRESRARRTQQGMSISAKALAYFFSKHHGVRHTARLKHVSVLMNKC